MHTVGVGVGNAVREYLGMYVRMHVYSVSCRLTVPIAFLDCVDDFWTPCKA